MDVRDAINRLKLSLPQIGRYAFRLGSRPDHLLQPRMNRLRDRIEAELTTLLRVRNKIMVSPESELLSRAIMKAIHETDRQGTDLGMDVVVATIRDVSPFQFSGPIIYIRAKVLELPDLPTPSIFEELAARGEGPSVEEWVENAITYPDICVFERIVLDNELDAKKFRAAFNDVQCDTSVRWKM